MQTMPSRVYIYLRLLLGISVLILCQIIVSVAHQTRIADDVLDFSKITVNLLTLHREPFLVCTSFESSTEMLTQVASSTTPFRT